ncbi:unnamed protein product [Schistosoma mattheei]|uniref:Uncharacterized protein n=1 Tax=Schistosoma mattheei TaxID=31246 RepID=A0A183Q6L5_9TREM|nr:unnamed protein product [Schistosoma mattheei]
MPEYRLPRRAMLTVFGMVERNSITHNCNVSQLLHGSLTEDKSVCGEPKKVLFSNKTSLNNSNSSSNCSNISSIPPITAAMDSLDWLSRRIGPVMTIKYIVKYLLTTLTLCYEVKDVVKFVLIKIIFSRWIFISIGLWRLLSFD